MLRSYWLPLIAIAGLALPNPTYGNPIGYQGAHSTKADHRSPVPSPEVYPRRSLTVQSEMGGIEAALKTLAHKPVSHYTEANTEAEDEVAKWTPWFWLVAFFELVITSLGVLLVFGTLREAKRSADEARRAANAAENALAHAKQSSENELRAWVDIDASLSVFSIGEQSINFGIIVTITNIGKTPAPKTWINCDISPSGTFIINKEKDIALSHDPHEMPPLLPNGTAKQTFMLSVAAHEVSSLIKSFVTAAEGVMVVVDIVAYYKTVFDRPDAEQHKTGARYRILPINWEIAPVSHRREWLLKGPDSIAAVTMQQSNSAPSFAD